MPSLVSSIDEIVAELSDYGARFRSDLAQDEFGPTRAERRAALRDTLAALEQAQSAIQGLNSASRQVVAGAFTPMPLSPVGMAVDPFARFEDEKLAVEALWLAATEARTDLEPVANLVVLDSIVRLEAAAEQAFLRLQTLDTASEVDLIFLAPPTQSPEPDERGDEVASVASLIQRLAVRLRNELDRLSRIGGPDRRNSLPDLVAKLCRLWERETGSAVTVNPYEKMDYRGVPQSVAGLFVCRVVEALQPTPSEISDRMNWSGRSSAPHLKSQLGWSPRAIHSAMRRYLELRNAELPREQHAGLERP